MVRMVFDASAKPHYLAISINDCMHNGPSLKPLLWDILLRVRVPFGAESSPFILGATLCYHYDQHEEEFKDTTETLRENTYIDSLINTGHRLEELKQFKKEATEILEKARFPVHKLESNLPELQSDDMANPGKIL